MNLLFFEPQRGGPVSAQANGLGYVDREIVVSPNGAALTETA
jgi:hypothetical protein